MPGRVPTYRPGQTTDTARLYERGEQRQADGRFYASTPWRKLRAWFLVRNPLCADCLKAGRVTSAAHIHHVKERKERPDLALDPDNLEALCASCHGAKRGEG